MYHNLAELKKYTCEDFQKQNAGVLGQVPNVKVNKYHNIPTYADGRTFDSGREAVRAGELAVLIRAGEICDLQFQVPFDISPLGHKEKQPIIYIADFVYIDVKTGQGVIEDSKGHKTHEYRIKKKLFEAKYAPLKITEV